MIIPLLCTAITVWCWVFIRLHTRCAFLFQDFVDSWHYIAFIHHTYCSTLGRSLLIYCVLFDSTFSTTFLAYFTISSCQYRQFSSLKSSLLHYITWRLYKNGYIPWNLRADLLNPFQEPPTRNIRSGCTSSKLIMGFDRLSAANLLLKLWSYVFFNRPFNRVILGMSPQPRSLPRMKFSRS